jgi:hypothetical protein
MCNCTLLLCCPAAEADRFAFLDSGKDKQVITLADFEERRRGGGGGGG